jgi:hypothetical protein
VIGYSKNQEGAHKLVTLYSVLDASTGQQLRVYQPSQETGNGLVCFSGESFTFMRTERGQLKLVTARAD